jgi:transcriptional regulator with XRE-family HTH domain
MSISERIEKICDFEGSQTKFSEKTGIVQQTISRIISKGSSIRSDNLAAIARAYPLLNIRWLLTGEGDMWVSEFREGKTNQDSESHKLREEIISLLKDRINLLEENLKDKDPELAKKLGIK